MPKKTRKSPTPRIMKTVPLTLADYSLVTEAAERAGESFVAFSRGAMLAAARKVLSRAPRAA